MRSILNLVLDHQGQATVFPMISLVAVLVTYLLYWISNRNKYMKYLPGVIMIIIGIYNLIEGLPRLTEDEGLSMILRFGIFFVAGFVSLCFALILGINQKYKNLEPGKSKMNRRKILKRKGNEN
ncbi:MAG: hypothetical protein Q4P34_04010 [Tissierellia bacterium]|nr:hypothetical protein [Tissierellia bacterium]